MATKQSVNAASDETPSIATHDLDLGPVEPWVLADRFQDSQLFAEFLNRLVTGRDMNIIITAASETGVGKTTLAAALAIMMDQHGWTHEKAAVADPVKYDRKYDNSPPGTVLILDEAEKAMDARRGMTKESVELTQSFATKRYKQVFSILTAPSKSWVDKRLGGDAADYWIQCGQTDLGRIEGKASVYRVKENEHAEQDYTTFCEYIEWPHLDWHPEYQKLDQRKVELLETDNSEETYLHRDEVEEMVEKRVQEAKREKRDELLSALYSSPKFSQSDLAEPLDISQSTVSNIVRS
jgi:Mrp family chromosome partitioning ATPase